DLAAAQIGGFEGNAQSFRLLTRLEAKTLHDDGRSAGLNLTRASLDAATKYPWPKGSKEPEQSEDPNPPASSKFGVYDDDLDAFGWMRAGLPADKRCIEAQVMDWADDVAYSVHDLEDGVEAGLIKLDHLSDVAGWHDVTAMATE